MTAHASWSDRSYRVRLVGGPMDGQEGFTHTPYVVAYDCVVRPGWGFTERRHDYALRNRLGRLARGRSSVHNRLVWWTAKDGVLLAFYQNTVVPAVASQAVQ